MTVFLKIIRYFILVLYLCFTGFVCLLNLRYRGRMDFATYKERIDISTRNPLTEMVLAAIILLILIWLVSWLEKHVSQKQMKAAAIFCLLAVTALLTAGSLAWCILNTYPPVGDPAAVWSTAAAFASDLYDDSCLAYFHPWPNQFGTVFFMEILIRIFRSDSFMVYRYFNIVCFATMPAAIASISYCLIPKYTSILFASLVSVLLVPALFYTAYVYGTIPSMVMVLWSIWFVIRYRQSGRVRYVLPLYVFLPAANLIYTGSAIGTVAAVLFLLYPERDGRGVLKNLMKHVLPAVLLAAVSFIIYQGVISWMFSRVGGVNNGGIPASATVYMGITSRERTVFGPGSYDGSKSQFYDAANGDYKKGDELAWQAVKEVFREYLNGERDPIHFLDKSRFQWTDAAFGVFAHTASIGEDAEGKISPEFEAFLTGPFLQHLVTILEILNPIVYLLAFLFGMQSFHAEIHRDKTDVTVCLCMIYFIGGFIFQLFWESKSRYTLPYFIALFPLAVCGISGLKYYALSRLKKANQEEQ